SSDYKNNKKDTLISATPTPKNSSEALTFQKTLTENPLKEDNLNLNNKNSEKSNENNGKIDDKQKNIRKKDLVSPNPTNTQEKVTANYTDQPHPGGFIYIENELNLTATNTSQGVVLNWTRCNSDQFVAYKIARSESASDVYFPRDGAIFSISNQNQLSIVDQSVEKGKTYFYRVCSYEKNGESWCGNVASITN
ncbi:MAG: hypothetical protein ACK4FL_03630, partial [Microgenomates group bacterium]